MSGSLRSRLARYGLAVLCPALAILVRALLDPILGDKAPFVTCYGAVAVAAWFGGPGPGLSATALGGLAAHVLFVAPRLGVGPKGLDDGLGLGGYLATCILLVAFSAAMQATRRRAETAVRDVLTRQRQLEREVARREDAQRKSVESVNLLTTVVEKLPVGIALFDPHGRYLLLNRALADLDGLSPEQHFGRTPAELFGEAGAALQAVLLRVAQTGRAELNVESSAETRAPVGRQHFWTNYFPIWGADDDLLGVAAAVVNVTELRRTQEQLALERARLEAVLQQMPVGVTISEAPSGRLLVQNARARQMRIAELFPSAAEAPPGGRHADGRAYRPDDWPGARALRHGETVVNEEVALDGTATYEVSAAPIRNASGRTIAAVMAYHDVSDRKRTEEALRAASRREMQHAVRLQQLADAAVRINAALSLAQPLAVTLQEVTEAARDIIGAHQAGTLRASDGGAPPVAAVSFSDKYAAWRQGGALTLPLALPDRPVRLDAEELRRHPRWGGLAAASDRRPPRRGWLAVPLAGHDGRPLGLLELSDKYDGEFSAEDEAVAVQLALMASVAIENADLYRRVQEADRRKDEFLAMLAHELRNPLAPIRNAVEVLRVGGAAADVAFARDVIDRQVRQLSRLVDDLLDVARITQGKVTLRREPVDVGAVVAQALETCRPLLEARRHALEVLLPPGPVWVDADPVRLAQVFANLLTNAAKYTDDGGRIWLHGEVAGDGQEVLVRVRDTGAGIAPEVLPHVFEAFTQADQTLARSHGGLGVGLTLARRLLELHGGSVAAHSAGAGQGSEFTVRLPVLVAHEGLQDRPASAPAASEAASRRVLVVDDNRDAVQSLVKLLEIWGHDVRAAYDGAAALRVAAEYLPEVVLLDIGLPELDGYEVARRLRQSAATGAAVLVAMTGYGQEEDRRRTQAAGFDEHLVKPVDPQALRQLLAEPPPPWEARSKALGVASSGTGVDR